MAAINKLHVSAADKRWIDPHQSPVMFEVWHMIYIYLVAIENGDLNPMLDFIIDGKYNPEFYQKMKPKVNIPDAALLLV